MGKIVKHIVCRTEYHLELTPEDVQKKQERQMLRQMRETSPAITEHEKRFAEHLLKCPFCGKTPRYGKVACNNPSGYDYKMRCDLHVGHEGSIALDCGDWFDTPAKAGRSWNERVREAKMSERERMVYWMLKKHRKELTRQQFRTLKGQIFTGDADGAMRGLERMMKGRA